LANSTMPEQTKRRGRRKQEGGNRGLSRAIRYLFQQGRVAAMAYGALVIATLAQLAVPLLVQNMINSVTNGATANAVLGIDNPITRGLAIAGVTQQTGITLEQLEQNSLNAEQWMFTAGIVIILFTIIRGAFAFVQAYMAEATSQGVAFDFRNEIFAKLQRLSFSYYDKNQTGQLMIRATDDVEKVRLFIAQGLVLATQSILLLTVTLAILLLTNWRLTMAILPILPVALVLFMVFGRIAQPLFVEVQKRLSKLNTILQENLAGIRVVKAFVREPHEQKHFDASADSLYEQQLKVVRTFAFLFPLIFMVAQLGQALILYFSSVQILGNTLTLGEYQQFTLYLAYVFFPIGQLGFIITLMAQASASATRIFEILDAESDVTNKPDAQPLPSIEGNVQFEDVTFRYFNSGDAVLKNVSFKAESGQTIALLGATGSGKSTIINLIPRFYDVSEGTIRIDGHDVRDVTIESLRQQIGIVLQETNLFGGTIRDNIAFGQPDATLEQVTAAAQAAAAHDFIMSFPQGYDTPVGERGTSLSGGQKQRIAIARALLLDPKLLILDDSTSAVDLVTEAQIQKALDQLMKGRTSFVIAQRITTVLNADQIIVLEKGEIAAIGTHAQLMEESAIYAEIYNSQLLDDAQPAGMEE
jgi:ATP-binding cassette subfamily B multidrug efflux pump